MSTNSLDPAPHDVERVREGIRRRSTDSSTVVLSPDGTDGGVVGPPGVWLRWERPVVTETSLETDRDAHRLVVVRTGIVVVRIDTEPPRALHPRDTLLIPPSVSYRVCAATPDADVVVIDYRERTPEGAWTDRGRNRGGFVCADAIRPLRERFPIRFAPAIHDVLSPRTLLPLVGPVAFGPGRFAIHGPQGLVVALVTTPPGTGPALHVHTQSTEIFVVLEGRFRVLWGEEGEHDVHLEAGDAIAIPPGFNRAFEAVGAGPHWLLPVVVGADDETEDIAWLPAVEKALRAAATPWQVAVALRTRLRIASRRPSAP